MNRSPKIIIILSLIAVSVIATRLLKSLPYTEQNSGSTRVYILYVVIWGVAGIFFIVRLGYAALMGARAVEANPKRTLDLAIYILVGTALILAIILIYMYIHGIKIN